MKIILLLFVGVLVLTNCQNNRPNDGDLSNHVKNTHIVKIFFPDGKLRFEYECVDSIPNGKAVEYFPDGNIAAKVTYANGKLNGLMTSYWENGLLKQVGNYKDDQPHGDVAEFYASGNLKSKRKYHNGLQVGKHVFNFDLKEERIQIIKEYVILGSEAYLNYEKELDEDGKVVKESPKLSFHRKGDSLEIVCEHKMFKEIRGVLGDYNIFFKSENEELDTIISRDGVKIVIPIAKDTVRGFIENFEFLDRDKGVSRDIWFSYPNPW